MYFGSFNPNGIFTTTPGTEFVDVTTWIKYAQNRIPSGSVWVEKGILQTQLLTATDVLIIVNAAGYLQTVNTDGTTIAGNGTPGSALGFASMLVSQFTNDGIYIEGVGLKRITMSVAPPVPESTEELWYKVVPP